MFTVEKFPGSDFKILNLTDPQLHDYHWNEGYNSYRTVLEYTVCELIRRVKPDLITITGDVARSGNPVSYKAFADFIDSFCLPWAPVWGNHDNQDARDGRPGEKLVDEVADMYLGYENCVYEKNDKEMGNGNYVIEIEERSDADENGISEKKTVHALFMMDSHDSDTIVRSDGSTYSCPAKLNEKQLEWYREQNERLAEKGCRDTSIFLHIPITAYRDAFKEAFIGGYEEAEKISLEESYGEECWNDGYKDSFGVARERVSVYSGNDGVLDTILDVGTTRHVIAGHDHVNNFSINYKGVRLIYALKTGAGCYWKPYLNGGTVLTVGGDGIKDVYHEYVDAEFIL